MGESKQGAAGPQAAKLSTTLVFSFACIAVNIAGAQASRFLELPVYFDTFGTVLAAMLGGYIPGVAVGYVTSLLNGIADSTSVYYGVISVLIALVTAACAKRGWFESLLKTFAVIVVLALLGGCLGTVLWWFVSGSFPEGAPTEFAKVLAGTSSPELDSTFLCAMMLVDFIDKTLVVLLASLVLHLLPGKCARMFMFRPWFQAPLDEDEMHASLKTRSRVASLQTKIVMLVGAIMAIVAVVTTITSYVVYHHSMIEEETKKATGIAELMAKAVDADRVGDYLKVGEDASGYAETEEAIAKIRDSFKDVQYAYVYKIEEDGCRVVFDPDTPDEPGSDLGELIPFDNAFQDDLPKLMAGEEIDPIISNESYGWLLTVYRPLKTSGQVTSCYAAVDVSMNQVIADEGSFLARVISVFAAFFILVCAFILWFARFGVILPINSISHAFDSFALGNESARAGSVEQIEALAIHTGDEVESLYDAVCKVSKDTVGYIAEAQDKSDTISRMQSNLLMVMADLIESRDKFTGDHVRNTATYTQIIMNQMRREGIYPDRLTDEFISNVVKSAPLHDVGKITVSDTILNKPGRFTDEEFEIMKNHTLAGKEILESATGAVSESSYLDEAQNLAAYHHEKWNGSGYPYGIAGEEIPLSARIMAVADVFDALVSKRSYKEGFPIEKALAIIEEGIGTHFDPNVARAFLHAKDKAREVAERSKAKQEEQYKQAEDEQDQTRG